MNRNHFVAAMLLLTTGMACASTASPPVDIQAPAGPVWTFMIANLVVSAIATTWMLVYSIKSRDAMPLWCFAGGLLAMFATGPALDHNLLVWYPVNTPFILTELYGVSMPLYLFVGYPWYVGLGAFACARMLARKADAATLWKFYWTTAVLDILIELPSTAAGVHIYYGNQPNFFQYGLSVQIPFVMPAIVLVCGMFLYALMSRLPKHLQGPCSMLSIPMASVGTLFAGSWPLMLAMNSDVAAWVVWLMAFVSIGLCLLIVHLGVRYFMPQR